jgi:enediyne biosynthesis protein E4
MECFSGIDLYVANDGQENQLWVNQRDGTFKDLALVAGAAWSDPGKAKAGMGVDAGDVDDDGDEDVFVTNLSGEGHDLYVNDATGTFEPGSAAAGLKHPSLPFTGFGTAWIDIDNDGTRRPASSTRLN